MFDRVRLRSGPIVLLWLVAGCAMSVTPEPLPSQPASGMPAPTAGLADRVCEADPFGCVVVSEGDPIIIGTALTLTGPGAERGLDSQYGAQVALNLREPVLGREVELVNRDDRCSAEGGAASVSQLTELEDLVAVIGTTCSSAARSATEILSERGTLLVSPSNTAPQLTAEDEGESFYARTAPNDAEQARAMAEWACAEAGVSSAATIGDGSEYAEAMVEAFATEFADRCAGTITDQAVATPEASAVDAALDAIATSNDGGPPELLYFPLPAELSSLVAERAAGATGLEDAILAGIRTGEDGAAASDLIDGVYLSAPMLDPSGTSYEGSFLEEYRSVSGHDEPIGTFHAHAYDAVNIVLDAVAEVGIEEAGNLYIPRSALRQAVYAMTGFEGLAGTYTCQATGDCSGSGATVSLVEGGSLEPVWP